MRKVTQQVLRKVDGVYDFETTIWESSDWRAITRAKSSTNHVYFSRNADGSFLPVVRMRADTMSPILSLLEELPDVYGPRNQYSGLSYDRHRNLSSEYRFKDDTSDIEIAVYREVDSKTKSPTKLNFYRNGDYEPEVWVDCDERRVHVAKDYCDGTPKGDTSIIEEVKAKLHELTIKQGDAA